MKKSALLLFAVALGGCAGLENSVVFVTKTSIGFDADSSPPGVALAYDRVEGFLGPRYDNGAVPPVVSMVETDGGIFNRNINQVYATGLAALKLTDANNAEVPQPVMAGSKKLMFFGTGTTFGVKVAFTGQTPDSITIGYKRKEYSYIPLGQWPNAQGAIEDQYPSVLGRFQTDVDARTRDASGFGLAQFFATGRAADALAQNEEFRRPFINSAAQAFAVYNTAVKDQQNEIVLILRCLNRIDDAKLPSVWKNADEHDLFYEGTYKLVAAEPDMRKARGIYGDNIGITEGKDATRLTRLTAHRRFVCGSV